MPVPMGIMEKSATIMNYDLGGESIEGFGGRALQALLAALLGNFKFFFRLDFNWIGGMDYHPRKATAIGGMMSLSWTRE